MNTIPELQFEFGKNILGPIFFAFCHRLSLYEQAFHDRKACLLFCTRGGSRLKYLFELYCRAQNYSPINPLFDLKTSRAAAAKSCLHKKPEFVTDNIVREFHGRTLRNLCEALIPQDFCQYLQAEIDDLPASLQERPVDKEGFLQLLRAEYPCSRTLRNYFSEQEALFDDYLARELEPYKTMLLCDSGMFGSTQATYHESLPDKDWYGLYFVKSNYRKVHSAHLAHAAGLIFDGNMFSYKIPESSLLQYWHLIEDTLEPDIPSVEQYFDNPKADLGTILDSIDWQAKVQEANNSLIGGVYDYFQSRGARQGNLDIQKRYKKAIKILRKKILFPSVHDTKIMNVISRGSGFNLKSEVAVLYDVDKGAGLQHRKKLIRWALWREGQIALCFSTPLHYLLQLAYLLHYRKKI